MDVPGAHGLKRWDLFLTLKPQPYRFHRTRRYTGQSWTDRLGEKKKMDIGVTERDPSDFPLPSQKSSYHPQANQNLYLALEGRDTRRA